MSNNTRASRNPATAARPTAPPAFNHRLPAPRQTRPKAALAKRTQNSRPTNAQVRRPISATIVARSYAPPCSKEDAAYPAFAKLGIPVREVPHLADNPHHLGAGVRARATAIALGKLYDLGHTDIIDIYGSPRTLDIAAFLNKQLDPKLKVTHFRPIITAKDMTRLSGIVHYNPKDSCSTGCLAVDIYDGWNLPALWQFYLRQTAAKTTYPEGIFALWVGRCFYGDAGECEEALWCRKEGKIRFSQDPMSLDPYVHDPLDWMWDGTPFSRRWLTDPYTGNTTMYTLFWTEVAVVGSMKIMGFGVTSRTIENGPTPMPFVENVLTLETPVVRPSNIPLVGGLVTRCLQQLYALARHYSFLDSSAVRYLFRTEKIVLYKPLIQPILEEFSTEKIRSYNISRISKRISAVLAYQTYSALQIRMPVLSNCDVHSLTFAVLHHDLEKKVTTVDAYSAEHGEQAARYNELTGNGFAVPPAAPTIPNWLPIIGVGVVSFGLGLLYKLRKGPSPAEVLFTDNAFVSIFVAPVIEEVFKRCLSYIRISASGPGLDSLFGLFELGYKAYRYKQGLPEAGISPSDSLLTAIVRGIPAVVLHESTRKMPLLKAIVLHAAFNALAMFVAREVVYAKFEPATLFADWRQMFYYAPWPERFLTPVARGSVEPFSMYYSATPRSLDTYSDFPAPCHDLIVTGTMPFMAERNPTFFYLFLPTQIPGYVPAVTDANLADAVRYRILAAPPCPPRTQQKNWKAAFKRIPISRHPDIFWEDELEAWLEHFDPKKQKKYRDMTQRLRAESWESFATDTRTTPVFMKSNELLFKFEKNFAQLKPRVIINVSPRVQVLVGPPIWRAQQNLKIEWPMIPNFVQGERFARSISYAGAATDVELSMWFTLVLAQTGNYVAIIVSGDDSFVITQWNGVLHAYEGDASMYDQSESFGPLSTGWKACRLLGVDARTITYLSELAHNSYTVRPRCKDNWDFLRINKRNRPIRDTGGADTSLGNSLVMGLSWFYASESFSENFGLIEVENAFTYLGLKMKLKKLSPYQGTFLKGMWYHTTAGPYWGPLPVRFFKMGKSLKDPREIYKKRDLALAAKMFLNDVAASNALFLKVPLMRRFVELFHKQPQIVSYLHNFQILPAKCVKPDLSDEAYEQLEIRYNVTREEWLAAEAMMPNKPFNFFCHPIFDRMAAVEF